MQKRKRSPMLKILTEQFEQEKGEYLSWSAVKDWNTCPFYFKLTKIDEIDGFKGNIHTAFGNGVHWTAERSVSSPDDETLVLSDMFTENFNKAISELPSKEQGDIQTEGTKEFGLHKEMKTQGRELVHFLIPALDKYFGKWELIAVEERFYEKCEFYDFNDFFFKGFIDLIIKTEDGRYHIIDWKTCGWGWTPKQKADKMNTYQLITYKHFFCQKYGIDPKNVETHFALCKRTNATDKRVELFKTTSGSRKMTNALNLLNTAVYNVEHGNHIKRKTSCRTCKFQGTEHCP